MEIRIHKTYFNMNDVVDGDSPRNDVETETHDAAWIESVRDWEGGWNADNSEWVPASVAESVVKLLRDEGLTEDSGNGDSYHHPDGSVIVNNYTGKRCEASAHLEGFDVETLNEIGRILSAK